ncbi:MAG: glutamine--fructose-6-phosphate transaminase (isomerizing) [Ignavibacteriae bacterium HGW-Ignavibacteriae-4]|jgi:glucosamine--fructose-6-phosphate aminotransferase (isomerizing)|nr:MAG: glutamine--fructose-6-phosphate transaminase (isomerizing) [Ignavibacteriae bacterium HGW-Ignavibacteriae-4]
MCGIVGYIGKQKASHILLNGLKRMEYRGYDSAGWAMIENEKLNLLKNIGKVAHLDRLTPHDMLEATVGIAHTRWATHGFPNHLNAHPHLDNSENIAVVHNGIIENYTALKTKLQKDGYFFNSDTDTEVLAVFIGAIYEKVHDLEKAVRIALSEIDGTFGIAVLSSYEPEKIICARHGSPMVLGIGEGEYIVASDAAAIIQHTNQVVYLNDKEMAIITRDGFITKTIDNEITDPIIEEINFDLAQIEKGGYDHFMLKEIHEQPETVFNSFRGRLLADVGNVKLGGLNNMMDKLRKTKRIIITACGTSWHAGLVGEYMIEQLAQISVEVEYASEFRYRNPIIGPDDVVFAISQSGETLDTLAAIKEARQKGATVIGIVNVVGSTIARETEAGVYIHAGPEIGVASTKAFTSQITVLALIALLLGRMRNLSQPEGQAIAEAMMELPDKIRQVLATEKEIKAIAEKYYENKNFLYLGRGFNYPLALEGALKLKEISYIHAEGYPAAEMKHGPIALIDENMPVVFIATKDTIYDKVFSNIEEVKARKGKIIAIATEGDERIKRVADHVIYVPEVMPMLNPILSAVPLQLLAYHIALKLECDVDQPRNLAKSVTVE